jgi:hypothetical protein
VRTSFAGSHIAKSLGRKSLGSNLCFLLLLMVVEQILSRTPELSDDVYKELVEQAKNEGYDVSKIHRTTHVKGIGGEDTDDKNTPSDRVGLWWLKSLVGK